MTGKPRFFYAKGTSYLLNILNVGFNIDNKNVVHLGDWAHNLGTPKQQNAAVAGLDGRTVSWTGDPASDPFCALMNPEIWDVYPINYPASTVAMGPSVDMGVTATVNAINAMPSGTPFALGGYSQGAAVMSGVLNEITSGTLTSRASDFLGGVTFGNPRRKTDWRGPVGGTWSGCWDIPDSTTGGHGSFPATGPYGRLVDCPDTWVDFASPMDIFTDVGDSTMGLEWVDANNLFLELLHSEYLGQFLNQFIGNFLVSKGIGQEHVTPMTDAINTAFGIAATINEFTDANGDPFEIGGYGHTYYPALPPEGDPDNGLTSFQIALKYLDTIADEYVRSPTLLPPTSAGWASKLYPPATQWYDSPSAAAVAVDFDYGNPSDPGGQVIVGGGENRPEFYHIDDYGGDPSGATNSNQALIDAYAAMGSNPGTIVFGTGTYLLYVGLNSAANRCLGVQQAIVGQGSALTFIDYRGPDACFEQRNNDFDNTGTKPAGGVEGLSILGWSSGETYSYGIRYGDIWRMRIKDVEISGFNRDGCIGLYGDNHYRWSERGDIDVVINQCTKNAVFESNTGDQGFPSGSFDYSQYKISFVAAANQDGFTLRSGTSGSKVTMNGSELTLTGNCVTGAGSNTGIMMHIGETNDDEASFSGMLKIGVETSGSSTGVAHYDFVMGEVDAPYWLVNSIVQATGVINLIPASGLRFQRGNATPKTFGFGGMLKGSSAFGTTGSIQTFQSLQLVSQARGGWYLSDTSEIQTVYVTESSGGTFTLTLDGYTTSAISYTAAMDSTTGPTVVQTALAALTNIGTGNVRVTKGQYRFYNSEPMDEIAFIVEFIGTLAAQPISLLTGNSSSLTGTDPSITVLQKVPGSIYQTYLLLVEEGGIFHLEPDPGTYHLGIRIGGLTSMAAIIGDSPFGISDVDIWIKQPESGGPAIFEGPYFTPEASAGSTYSFNWFDGQEPVISQEPSAVDVLRVSSYNFSVWIGQHITRLSTTTVEPPSASTDPGVQGQIAVDSNYMYWYDNGSWNRVAKETWT